MTLRTLIHGQTTATTVFPSDRYACCLHGWVKGLPLIAEGSVVLLATGES